MSPDDIRLSACLDNELSEHEHRRLGEQLQNDAVLRRRYERLRDVREFLHSDEQPDIAASMQRTWHRLSLRNLERPPVRWWRRPIPVPVSAMAAGIALVILAGALLSQLGGAPAARAERRAEPLSSAFELSAQLGESERLLQRLPGAEALDEITIRLPESRRFEFIGEPVIVPSGRAR